MLFKSLRSRLILSYFAVILTVLLAVAAALFVFAAFTGVRQLSSLQRLAAISVGNRQELIRLREAGADGPTLAAFLAQTAVAQNVRIVVTNARTHEVIYDTQENNSWVGISISRVRPVRLFATADSDALIGRFQHPNGTSWLVYSQPFNGRDLGRIQIFYTQREPTVRAFFSEFFARPLLAAGAIALLLALVLAFWIAHSVARPLRHAVTAAEAIAQGDYDQQLSLRGPEEVQRVASSFNAMAAQVKLTQQAQRDFIANVSHDLKTPLTSIRGWSQAILDGLTPTAVEQQQAAGIIHSEAERMARLVNELLVLVRLDSGQLALRKELVNLGHIVADVQHNLVLRAEEAHIQLISDLQPVPPIVGDPDRLVQVFTNLVDNALTHTPSGGQIRLLVRGHGERAVEGVVQDTGIGIPSDKLPRIFERFYQADSSRAREREHVGSGLGLAIVKELVEAHRGLVLVFSEVGQGTSFVVRLPISDSPEEATIIHRAPRLGKSSP